MKSILLDNIYFISPNGNNIDWNFLASVPIFFDFENLNLSFVDISDLEEKSLVQVKEFLLIKNIYEFFCSFINYQLIKRVLTIFASSYPIIKDLKTLEKIQFIFSTLPNENTISYQIRLNKTVINTSFNYLIEFDLLLNIRQFKESSEIFLMNFNYENYKEENLNILNAKGSDQIPALIDRNLILNSLKFKIKEVKETFLAIQKNHWNYNTSLIQMESWLKGLSLQDASLDFLKINAAIVYSLKLFLAQSSLVIIYN